MNVVMPVRGRPRLTHQAIESLINTTLPITTTLTIVDENDSALMDYKCALNGRDPINVLVEPSGTHILGKVKNFGVNSILDRSEPLVICDNDCYFTYGWYERMIPLLKLAEKEGVLLLGGQNHPYHKPIGEHVGGLVREYYAVAGTCWMMSWSTWDRFGPFVETGAPGIGQSEDQAFCQKIRDAGYKVGACWPEVVYDCGITNTDGTLSVGHDVKLRRGESEGVIYE
jgi:hypothetical protein